MTLRTSALANNCSKASSRFPTSRVTSSFGPAATELRPLLRCMAAPFDRCTAYFGAPFHTHTLGCGQTIVVRLVGTLEAGPGIPRSEYMRRRLMSESGQTRSFGDVGSMSGLPESGHDWTIYEYTPWLITSELDARCRRQREPPNCKRATQNEIVVRGRPRPERRAARGRNRAAKIFQLLGQVRRFL